MIHMIQLRVCISEVEDSFCLMAVPLSSHNILHQSNESKIINLVIFYLQTQHLFAQTTDKSKRKVWSPVHTTSQIDHLQ